MNLVAASLALEGTLPPPSAFYEYTVGAGGLYVRADDGRVSACVPVASVHRPLTGLAMVEPYARLLLPKVPSAWLLSILESARRAMPAEAMYQVVLDPLAKYALGGYAVARPKQAASPGHVTFLELSGEDVVADVHSHHSMRAFFSSTDDADEMGLRFYCVIGRLDIPRPQIAVRVGVYGHTMRVPARTVFEGLGPFMDTFGRCRVCGCTQEQGCREGCWWVEEDLCSACLEKETDGEDSGS